MTRREEWAKKVDAVARGFDPFYNVPERRIARFDLLSSAVKPDPRYARYRYPRTMPRWLRGIAIDRARRLSLTDRDVSKLESLLEIHRPPFSPAMLKHPKYLLAALEWRLPLP